MTRIDVASVGKYVRAGTPTKEAASKLGISQESFRVGRDIHYLFDEEGLTEEQNESLLKAIRLYAGGSVKDARELIDPIMFIRFGDVSVSGPNTTGGPLTAREYHREQFNASVVSLVDHMVMAKDVKVPWLEPDQRDRLCDDLDRGVQSISTLKANIMKGGSHVPDTSS